MYQEVEAVGQHGTVKAMLADLALAERREMLARFKPQKATLVRWFPRGRVAMFEDGRAVLVARAKSLAGCHAFVHGPESVGIYWCAARDLFRRAVEGLLESHPRVDCEIEGFIYLRPDPRLPERLAFFCRGKQGAYLRKKAEVREVGQGA